MSDPYSVLNRYSPFSSMSAKMSVRSVLLETNWLSSIVLLLLWCLFTRPSETGKEIVRDRLVPVVTSTGKRYTAVFTAHYPPALFDSCLRHCGNPCLWHRCEKVRGDISIPYLVANSDRLSSIHAL